MAETKLADLDPLVVAQNEEFLVAWLKESAPGLDLSEGRVLRELLIRKAAIFHTLEGNDLQNLRLSMSMSAIAENPELADPAIVDAVLSNFNIERDPGIKATGQITIVVENLLTTAVPISTTFTTGSISYQTTRSFVGVTTPESVLDPTIHRLILRRNDGFYGFVIDVDAVEAGAIYSVRRNTDFPVAGIAPAPTGIVSAYATQDFAAGRNSQSNADLVEIFKLAMSPKVMSGRTHIESALRDLLPDTKSVSIIGFGDQEMIRDRHNIFKVSHGGKADIYLKSQAYPQTIAVLKDATLIDSLHKTLQISIGRDDAPGFYTLEAVLRYGSDTNAGSLEIKQDIRSLDLTSIEQEFVPDVSSMVEGSYSRYQTSVIQFVDPQYDAAAEVQYQVYLRYMPGIKTAQDKVNNRAFRNPQADYLVRAPIPAFVTVTMQVQYADPDNVPDTAKIRQAVSEAINGLNFSLGRLPASLIHDAVHTVIGTSRLLVVSPLDIICMIHKPGSDVVEFRSENMITIPNLPAECVSSRTVIFFAQPDDIDVSLKRVTVLPV